MVAEGVASIAEALAASVKVSTRLCSSRPGPFGCFATGVCLTAANRGHVGGPRRDRAGSPLDPGWGKGTRRPVAVRCLEG